MTWNKMKDEKKMKISHDVLDIFNMAMCFVAAVISMFLGDPLAACGWLCACLVYLNVYEWKNPGMKSIDMLYSLIGGKGDIVKIEVCRLNNGKDGKDLKEKEPKKDLPDFAPKAAESFHECAKEFFHYVEEGNRDFSISHGGVTLSVSIPESAPGGKDADTPQT